MILTFHFHNHIHEYLLSSDNDRSFNIGLGGEFEENLGSVVIEVWNRVWHILPGDEVVLKIGKEKISDHILSVGDVIDGTKNGIDFAIRVDAMDVAYAYYEKFSLKGKNTVKIGGSSDSDILIHDEYVSNRHANLQMENGGMVLNDSSTNGTYVRGHRVDGAFKLSIMDDIYIAGVKLVYMGDFLAINRAEKRSVRLNTYVPDKDAEVSSLKDEILIRSPRVLESLYDEVVELESPPSPQNLQQRPAIFTIGPAITMPLPIMVAMMVNFGQGANIMTGMVISIGLSAVVAAGWAIVNMVYDRKKARSAEEHRQNSYRQYISENESHLKNKNQYNTDILNGRYLSLSEIASILPRNKGVLWNRNVNQPDFLTVRLGTGCAKPLFNIAVPKRKFSLVSDSLQSLPHELKERQQLMQNCVSTINMREMRVVGVLGTRVDVRKLAGNLALQIAALHCYTDVRMAFLMRPGEERFYGWAQPLPHVRWQENKIRLMASDDNQRQNVLYYLNGVLRTREEMQREATAKEQSHLPHIIIFCTDPEILRRESISRYISDKSDVGITFVLLYERADLLPNECSHIIQSNNDFCGFYRLDQSRDETNKVQFDEVTESIVENLSRQISGYVVTELSTGEIPSAISFLEMYGIKSLDEWELNKRWRKNRAHEGLKALLGIGVGGKPLYLDIHEKQHGPHGLIAGTTGSGKSETIQTYILSLVMNFHPNEIALILLDYKGGGMANAFLGLPHLAGTITNLGGNQTNRALLSIKAEIKRRQTLFNEFNVNHIDSYSQYFRNGEAKEPMPHLIIISDEFAELKKEQPEFIKELVSTARVGRSLGVHLILATQKPSGVVDDEIWSNSRFKICLRVQDKHDSTEMLHRPDAAFLTNTGRAYMQIGNDEIFELFQAGYSGANYEPEDTDAQDGNVSMIALDGSPMIIRRKKTTEPSAKSKDVQIERPTQLSASVRFIRETSKKLDVIPVRKLWLPELQEGISLEYVKENYTITKEKGVTALIGVIDDPSRQIQFGATLNFSTLGNLLIAGIPGSGKSTLLQTMLYTLVMNYPPEEINFYVIDCSGSLSKVFMNLPHCGAVISGDDNERVFRVVGLIQEIMSERGRLFEKAQVGSYEEYRRASGDVMPIVLLAIDNLFAFSERYEDMVNEQIFSISHICAKFGIHLVVSANHMNDVKYKLRQNFSNVLALQLAERGDYHAALGVMPEFIPSGVKGRGLWGREILEFQVALAVDGENEQVRAGNMRTQFESAGYIDYPGFKAMPVRSIPRAQSFKDFLSEQGDTDAYLIGYSAADVSVVSAKLDTLYCCSFSASSRKAADSLQRNLMDSAVRLNAKIYLTALKYKPDPSYAFEEIYHSGDELLKLLLLLKEEFTKRAALKKEQKSQETAFNAIREQYGLLFVFIDSMEEFLDTIYEDRDENYYPLVELFFKQGREHGCYFISRFEPSLYSSSMYREAYKLFVSHGFGIHIGGQLDKQKHIDIPFVTREQTIVQDVTEGLLLMDEQLIRVFVPQNQPRQ